MIEVTGCLGIRAFMDASDELNSISAAAMGEAAPEVPFKVDSEGGWVVPSMKRTGAGELIIFCPEMGIESVCSKDLSDGNTGFEEVEAIGDHALLLSRAGLGCAGLS
jgi:hypothetical protein